MKPSSLSSLFIIILILLIVGTHTFSTPIIMNTIKSTTLQNTYTDISQCSCNLHPSICDNFCCCDSICPQSQLSSWTTSTQCKNKQSNIQTLCQNLSNNKAYLSFQNLGCVYYSNRGNIGYFYEQAISGALNYPNSDKFVTKTSSSQSINLKTSSADTSLYTSITSIDNKNLLKYTKEPGPILPKYFQIWSSVASGDCELGYVSLNKSGTYSCEYPLSINTCQKSTDHVQGILKLCKQGNCNQTQIISTVQPASLNSNIACNNFIKQQSITLTLTSSGSTYIISSINVVLTQVNVTFSDKNSRYPIKTIININLPSTSTVYSGNPGYKLGKPVVFLTQGAITMTSTSIFSISDSSGSCIQARVTPIKLLFGQNTVYSCLSLSPCGNNLYIDSIIKQTQLRIQKWATASTQTISIAGMDANLNSCQQQTITLNILYTVGGWVQDKQAYILSSSISTQKSVQSNFNRKYLKINWIYVDYNTISNPPTNNFYQYFSYIWKPLRQYFGVYSN